MTPRKRITYIVSPPKQSAAGGEDAATLNRQGMVLARNGDPGAALACFERAIAQDPQHAEAHSNRGAMLHRLGRHAEALASLDRAVALRPDLADAHSNRGNSLMRLGRLEEALASYDRAIAIAPGHAEAHGNRGNALMNLGRYDLAVAAYDEALRVHADYPRARSNRALCLLTMGRFTEGWRDYEARWDEWAAQQPAGQALLGPHNLGKPLWDGARTPGRLLVWAEQGPGDQILFASMLGEAAERCGKLLLAVDPRLHALFRRSFPGIEVMTLRQALKRDRHDLQIPLGSLGRLLRNSSDDFLRRRAPWLKADPERSRKLRNDIARGGERLCGLSWFSRNQDSGDFKSLPLAALQPLLDIPGMRFVDLQYGDTAAERDALKQRTGIDIHHVAAIDNLDDIDGLAALVDICDVVVTISNSTAHLAGALGKTVLLMLPRSQGRLWYWRAEHDETLWYPRVHLFRQAAAGDWPGVVARVGNALGTMSRDPASVRADSLAMMRGGRIAPARDLLCGLLAAHPGDAEALHLLGTGSLLEHRNDDAVAQLRAAIAARPDHAPACAGLGLALDRLHRPQEALAQYDRAIKLQPGLAEAHARRGVVLNALQQFAEAVEAYDRALALDPRNAEAWCNRGVALNNLNRHDDAVASYDRALALQPDYAAAHWNRCLALLTRGEFSRGWQQYGWRWKKREITYQGQDKRPFWYGTRQRRGPHDLPHGVPCAFDPPFWDGQPNTGSLLVWPEQGVGEQVLFSSMLNEARSRVGKLTLILEQKLHPLFQRSFPGCRIVTFETAVAENNFDWQIPLGELGHFFRPSLDDFILQRRAYLKADRARSAALHKEIDPKHQHIVGLSWYSRNAEYGAQKTLSLELLAPLLAMPDLRFVDLQYGDTTTARDAIRRKTGVEISRIASVDNWEDVDGFAALVNACDLVVTVSNTTAHIAGALGKDVLLMLPHSQGRFWYWQAGRDDSLFYPGMQIFRQHASGDWSQVIAKVCAAASAHRLESGQHAITFPISRNSKVTTKADIRTALRRAAGHMQRSELEAAQQIALEVVRAEPQNFDALHMLGVIAGSEGRNVEAVDFISKALALKPNANAHVNRGAARLELKHYAKALADADKAIELAPDLAVAHCVRGHALTGLKRIEEAFSSYDAAVTLNPDYDEAWHHRGNACMSLGMLQDAMASYDRSLAINPANFGGMGNQSMCYLLAGDFSRGWERYEVRWKALEAGFVAPPGSGMFMLTPENFGKPLWDGTPTRGTVLVWPEQGIGDQIIFASMLADLQPRVGKVVLALDERLHPLFARSFPGCEIITREAARRPNNYDFQIPAGGLGKHFRRSINDCIQHRRAFLLPDKARSARLREAIDPGNLRLCGLSWSSIHPEFGNDKSMTLATMQPLLETPGFRFVDLQYGDTSAERAALKQKTGIDIVHLDDIDLTKDIDGLAALIDACDVIVTISNTTAHIAGALGKEVWLMLPQNMGRFWYWQTDRDDTLWYPNVHVVRQHAAGEWEDVIDRVRTALAPANKKTPASRKKAAPKKVTALKKAPAARKSKASAR